MTSKINHTVSNDPADYLVPTEYIDFEHPLVKEFVDNHIGDATDDPGKVLNLYYAIRDEIRYDPYAISLKKDTYKASYVIEKKSGYCIQKATAFAAACRSIGVPARPGYADVRNHLATKRLLELIETDTFIYHGYVQIWLSGKWIKVTPVFNISLCKKFNIHPLDFDGQHDSLFHPFDTTGKRHMEYLQDRGVREDVPVTEITTAMKETFPKLFREPASGDFEAEAAREQHTAEFKR